MAMKAYKPVESVFTWGKMRTFIPEKVFVKKVQFMQLDSRDLT